MPLIEALLPTKRLMKAPQWYHGPLAVSFILGAHACFLVSLCLLFASVGQASARTIASLPWTLFTSLLTHRLVLLCIDAHRFIFWDLPGDVLAAPESALGLDRCNTSFIHATCGTAQPGH